MKRNTLIQHLVRNTDLGRRYSVSRPRVVVFSLEYIMAEATQEESADTQATRTTCDRHLLAEPAAPRASELSFPGLCVARVDVEQQRDTGR